MVEVGREDDRRGKDCPGQTSAPRLVAPRLGKFVLERGLQHDGNKVTNNLGPFRLFRYFCRGETAERRAGSESAPGIADREADRPPESRTGRQTGPGTGSRVPGGLNPDRQPEPPEQAGPPAQPEPPEPTDKVPPRARTEGAETSVKRFPGPERRRGSRPNRMGTPRRTCTGPTGPQSAT